MSGAAEAVQAALVAALRTGLGLQVSGVFDGPPARAAYPYIAIAGGVSSDWSHKSGRGREHRLAITIWDDGASPARLHGLIAQVEDAIEGMGRDLDGHRVVSLVFLRSRIVRDADGPWAGLIEYRARSLEV